MYDMGSIEAALHGVWVLSVCRIYSNVRVIVRIDDLRAFEP